jgi:hypothetical protein
VINVKSGRAGTFARVVIVSEPKDGFRKRVTRSGPLVSGFASEAAT